MFAILLAAAFSQTYATNNLALGLSLLLIGSLSLFFLRKRVTEVIVDEMVYAIGGKAALAAVQIYSWLAVIIMLVAGSLKQINPALAMVSNTMAFSACALMLIYSASYYFFAKSSWKDPKFIFTAILVLIFIAFFAAGIFMKLL